MSDYLDPNNEELLKDFFSEAQLQVDILEQNILVLENDPANRDAVDEIFRAAHTLKGGAATVEMRELAGFTHLVEDVLDEIRNGSLTAGEDVVDGLLTSIDVIKAMLEARSGGRVYAGNTAELEARLRAFLPGSSMPAAEPVRKPAKPAKTPAAAPRVDQAAGSGLSEYELLELKEAAGKRNVYRITVEFDERNPMNTVGGIQVFALLKTVGQVLKTVPEFEKLYEDNFFPKVDYYVASGEPVSRIEEKVTIPDVTLGSSVSLIIDASSGTQPRQKKQTAPEQTPGAEQASSAPAANGTAVRTDAAENDEPAAAETKPAEDGTGLEQADDQRSKDGDLKKGGSFGSILRVDSRRIDNLLNLVSETVITKATFNQIAGQYSDDLVQLQTTSARFREKLKDLFDVLPEYLERIQNGESVKLVKKDMLERFGEMLNMFDPVEAELKSTVAKFRSTAQNLGRITGELQEGVMRIRMVPISQIFSRFPRLVRDLSKSLKKKIALKIEGEETELDKSVIEDLLDPLIHCVRNSIDHGVELPEERAKAGKPEEGQVRLKASNEGNMIVIEISDDGKGIDVDAVRTRAVERGIIHPNKSLTDIEAFNLIFEPGFSTAKSVTNVSGRGVGLDVVRKQIEKLNGSVSVWSERGKGTRFTIKLPLTLAIIQGLLVRVGREIYAIPISSVIESHRIKPSDIKMIDNYEVFNVRDDVISLLRLNRLFRIRTAEQQDFQFIVIVGSNEKKMGLMVDSLIGEEDVVIKPLKDQYTNSPGIAGATILGDGTVSLIIDVSQLLELGLKRELEERRRREAVIDVRRK